MSNTYMGEEESKTQKRERNKVTLNFYYLLFPTYKTEEKKEDEKRRKK